MASVGAQGPSVLYPLRMALRSWAGRRGQGCRRQGSRRQTLRDGFTASTEPAAWPKDRRISDADGYHVRAVR